jgi:hypothetical protein
MSSVLSHPTMPEDCEGATLEKRYRIDITAQIVPGEEPTPEQIRDFFNAFFSEGFQNVWRAATCDQVSAVP